MMAQETYLIGNQTSKNISKLEYEIIHGIGYKIYLALLIIGFLFMVLAIDMGNTNIVIGCIENDSIVFEERLCTDHSKTELEYAIGIKTVLELYNVDVNKIDVSFSSKEGTIAVCKNGAGVDFSEEIAKKILLEKEINII